MQKKEQERTSYHALLPPCNTEEWAALSFECTKRSLVVGVETSWALIIVHFLFYPFPSDYPPACLLSAIRWKWAQNTKTLLTSKTFKLSTEDYCAIKTSEHCVESRRWMWRQPNALNEHKQFRCCHTLVCGFVECCFKQLQLIHILISTRVRLTDETEMKHKEKEILSLCNCSREKKREWVRGALKRSTWNMKLAFLKHKFYLNKH